MNPLIRCGFGIGNRVAALANGFSLADSIRFVWRHNPVCPVAHHEVFPHGIPGVEFITTAPLGFATRIAGIQCDGWHACASRPRAAAAYARIMDAMAGTPATPPPALAIIARFHRFPRTSAAALAALAATLVPAGSAVFLLADSRRDQLSAFLRAAGLRPILPASPAPRADLDRTRASTLAYLPDWKTALSASAIVTHAQDTSVFFPALAAGIPIHRTPP